MVIRAGQIEVVHPFVPLGNSGTVPRGQRLESPWSGLGGGFQERVLGCVRSYRAYDSCWLLVKKVFPKRSAMLYGVFSYSWEGLEASPGLRWCLCCLVVTKVCS